MDHRESINLSFFQHILINKRPVQTSQAVVVHQSQLYLSASEQLGGTLDILGIQPAVGLMSVRLGCGEHQVVYPDTWIVISIALCKKAQSANIP